MQIDTASILAIALLVAILFLAWRRNGAQPDVDRALVQELGKVKNRVAKVEADLSGCATRVDIAALTGKIDALEEHAASTSEVVALEGKVNVVIERVSGMKQTVEEVRESQKVIERLLMKGALDR